MEAARTFTPAAGATSCALCPPGSFQPYSGEIRCHPCPIGTYMDAEGGATCASCTAGTFAEHTGAVACTRCPPNTNNFIPQNFPEGRQALFVPGNLSDCLPEEGFYGVRGAEPTECPKGATCCQCLHCDAWKVHGYTDRRACDERLMARLREYEEDFCPEPCTGGTVVPVARPGYIRSSRAWDIILRCPLTQSCDGAVYQYQSATGTWWGAGSSTDKSQEYSIGYCHASNEKELCGACARGHTLHNRQCRKCAQDTVTRTVLFMVFLLITTSLLIYTVVNSASFFKSGALSVFINFMHTQATFFRYDMGWPEEINTFMRIASLFTIDFSILSPQCTITIDFYELWALTMTMPLTLPVILLVLYYGVRWMGYMEKISNRKVQLWQAYLNNAFFSAGSFIYTSVVINAFSIMNCQALEDGSYYLTMHPAYECYSGLWWSYFIYGAIGCALYAVGFPLGTFLYLHWNRHRLRQPLFKKSCGSMYMVFHEDFYWWSTLVSHTTKLFLITMVVVFSDNIPIQVWAALIVLLGNIILGFLYSPFRFEYNNFLDSLAAVTCYVTLSSGLYYYSEKLNQREERIITFGLLAALAATLLVLLHGVVYDFLNYHAPNLKNVKALSFIFRLRMMEKLFSTKTAMQHKMHWAHRDKILGKAVLRAIDSMQCRKSPPSRLQCFGSKSRTLPPPIESIESETSREDASEDIESETSREDAPEDLNHHVPEPSKNDGIPIDFTVPGGSYANNCFGVEKEEPSIA
ncbi:hypothetical protein CYMTET_29329 [Cymbomonas tetramitiformis]|uniref:Tyrosine-protein kinase ephrin type A/B receptor-like domain-containing protein n=1 Tax=Cymbomonas tetramitiformis TaxID=36881 RepID=A0AAE0FLA2_9CHLO|nr:hypothetical protein CYMTET_29329 [Cymbomonas tetramitiformis]